MAARPAGLGGETVSACKDGPRPVFAFPAARVVHFYTALHTADQSEPGRGRHVAFSARIEQGGSLAQESYGGTAGSHDSE